MQMNILMLSSTFPYPPSRGGTEIRTFNLLKYLQKNHKVTLATQRHRDVSDAEVEELRQWVSKLVIFPLPEPPLSQNPIAKITAKALRLVESLAKGTPPNVLYRYSPEMQAWIDDFVASGNCDVITCEHSVNEIYIQPRFPERVRTVVNIHSSVSGWTRNHLEMGASPYPLRDRLYLTLLLDRYEKNYASKFDKLVVTTEDDKSQFLKYDPKADIQIVANGVDLELFPQRPQPPTGHKLAFVGAMDASHNIDAARFFALEILPELQKRYADVEFTIVGARPVQSVLELANRPGVKVTGAVPRVAEYLHQAAVCVVPLRSGYGIKNKTLEAMATGVPLVASDRGLEGLAVDGSDVPLTKLRALRANRVEEYVEAIGRLFEDEQLRNQLSVNGRSLIETQYTWEAIGQCYEQVLVE